MTVFRLNKEQAEYIYNALYKASPEDGEQFVNDVKEAFPLMRKLSDNKTYVLLENDLPDIFNE